MTNYQIYKINLRKKLPCQSLIRYADFKRVQTCNRQTGANMLRQAPSQLSRIINNKVQQNATNNQFISINFHLIGKSSWIDYSRHSAALNMYVYSHTRVRLRFARIRADLTEYRFGSWKKRCHFCKLARARQNDRTIQVSCPPGCFTCATKFSTSVSPQDSTRLYNHPGDFRLCFCIASNYVASHDYFIGFVFNHFITSDVTFLSFVIFLQICNFVFFAKLLLILSFFY